MNEVSHAPPNAADRACNPASPEANTEMAKLEAEFHANLARDKRRAAYRQIALNILGVLLFFAAWEVVPRSIPNLNLLMFPPPSGIVNAFVDLVVSGALFWHALVSLLRSLTGFAIGATLGVIIGVLTARILPLRQMSDPVLHGMRSIPVIAMVPLAIIWFGIGEVAKLALITWGAFYPVWVNSFLGARDVHLLLIRSAQSLGASRIFVLLHVILPGALPLIIAGLRLSLAISFVVMVAAELVGASEGLGHLIANSHQLFRVDYMFVGLVTLGAIGFLFDQLFVAVIARLFPWYGRAG